MAWTLIYAFKNMKKSMKLLSNCSQLISLYIHDHESWQTWYCTKRWWWWWWDGRLRTECVIEKKKITKFPFANVIITSTNSCSSNINNRFGLPYDPAARLPKRFRSLKNTSNNLIHFSRKSAFEYLLYTLWMERHPMSFESFVWCVSFERS